jgi:hypothetical protein
MQIFLLKSLPFIFLILKTNKKSLIEKKFILFELN